MSRRTSVRQRRQQRGLSTVLAPLLLGGGLTAVATPAEARDAVSAVELVRGQLGVVTAESPLAAEAGLEMLRSGGNAVDAAVAAAFAIGVVRFDTCGIGGGGFLVYRGADGTVDTLDFYERAPGKGATYTDRPGMGPEGAPSQKEPFTAERGVPFAKDVVKDAPRIDPEVALTAAEEEALWRHYGQEYVHLRSEDAAPAAGAEGGLGDDAMTRSEEEVHVSEGPMRPAERVRLRKVLVTEHEQRTIPVRREVIQLETDAPPEGHIEEVVDADDDPSLRR